MSTMVERRESCIKHHSITAQLEKTIDDIAHDVWGNGKPGLKVATIKAQMAIIGAVGVATLGGVISLLIIVINKM